MQIGRVPSLNGRIPQRDIENLAAVSAHASLNGVGAKSIFGYLRAYAEGSKDLHGIRRNLNTRADVGEFSSLLKNMHLMTKVQTAQCSG